MGVESGSQRILDAMGKGLSVSDVVTARTLLADKGIRACFFLQFGYPGETWEDIQQTIDLVRSTRPDDIGISFSYPLPGTAFYERVQEQIGDKRNWTDSDDLCVMFSAAYNNDFYMALRNALHCEADTWKNLDKGTNQIDLATLWQRVFELEGIGRNSAATFSLDAVTSGKHKFVPLQMLIPAERQV
jgi:anaerobic magnesium-protoporphyrin IX monomethyl ester cyclase